MTFERIAIEGRAAVVLGCAVLLGSCTGDARPEAHALTGEPLLRPVLSDEMRDEHERNLEAARREAVERPDDVEALIWLGRRTAYLGRYREAIEVYGRGIERWPESHELYRHRGHRWITVRELDRAIADLERASRLIEGKPDTIEPDGLPNRYDRPRSTSHSNIWYHLGLAYYLRHDFDNARHCYERCLVFSTNPDMLVATSHWLYMTLRRLDRDSDAAAVLEPIEEEMEILENDAYHQLLLMYRGRLETGDLLQRAAAGDDGLSLATIGYGVGNWHLVEGRPDEASAIFERVVEGQQWAAFGHIAAEAELSRAGDVVR